MSEKDQNSNNQIHQAQTDQESQMNQIKVMDSPLVIRMSTPPIKLRNGTDDSDSRFSDRINTGDPAEQLVTNNQFTIKNETLEKKAGNKLTAYFIEFFNLVVCPRKKTKYQNPLPFKKALHMSKILAEMDCNLQN